MSKRHMIRSSLLFLLSLSGCETPPAPGARESALAVRGAVEVAPEPGAVYAQQVFAIAEILPPNPDDRDADGFAADVDPDDDNRFAYPGAYDVPCDEIDEDGDGVDPCEPDADGDGSRADRDCDDLDPSIAPLAAEIFCNGADENCDGQDSCDSDHDGADDREDAAPFDPAVGGAVLDEEEGSAEVEDHDAP